MIQEMVENIQNKEGTKKMMRKRTRQCLTTVTTAAMVVSSIGAGVPAMAAKVTLPKTVKVAVGAQKVLKLKNNKQSVKWKISKGKKCIKIVKKNKKSCTVKGIKKGNATVQAVIGSKKYSCKIKVTAKAESQTTGTPAANNTSATTKPLMPTNASKTANPPSSTSGGVSSNAPAVSDKPGVSGTPAASDKPGVSDAPEESGEPNVSNVPKELSLIHI